MLKLFRPEGQLREPLLRLLRLAGTAALLGLWSAAGGAQEACESALGLAEKSYQLGLFEDVPGQLVPCLRGPTSRSTAIRVHSLLARTYLATDDLVKARVEVSAILRLDSSFEAPPPPRFAQLVAQVRREEATVQVESVSKTKESLREAPATVIVITGEEIRRRGYLDLEQILHDLPGFDISRSNGDVYSYIYQRGFRRNNDRNLLLVDGVEQNDLTSNVLYLSRQYPMSNIDRIEVIYGPASTMYGANAFTGVINVVTKQPEALIAEGKRLGFEVQAAGGGYRSRYADLTVAGKDGSGNVAWSLSSHLFRSDERDLSGFPDWDYNYQDYKRSLRLVGPLAQLFSRLYPCSGNVSPYYRCASDNGQLSIELTDEGERRARELDRQLIADNNIHFSDDTDDLSVFGKLRISNLVLGVQLWRTREGWSSFLTEASEFGSHWTPRQTLFYLQYSHPVGKDLTFRAFSRYQSSRIEGGAASEFHLLHTYDLGLLHLWDLTAPCISPLDGSRPPTCPAQPFIEVFHPRRSSDQLRSELTLVYDPSEKLSAVAGIDFWESSIQSDTVTDSSLTGVAPLPEHIQHTNLAAYAQASYKPRKTLRLTLAGRLDHNEINDKPSASGFGTLFTPRAAVIYMPGAGRWVFKAIYSEAFKDPTDLEKFGIELFVRQIPSPPLRPERVRNYELSAGWAPSQGLSVEGAAYQAEYRDVVELRAVQDCTLPFGIGCARFENAGRFRVRGLQLTARYTVGNSEMTGNYTYTEPFELDPRNLDGSPILMAGHPSDTLRIGDIATHRVNLGWNVGWTAKLNSDLRLRYVGSRETGPGTTVPGNIFHQIDAYSVVEAALTFKLPLPATTLQLLADNLFDAQYYDPATNTISAGNSPRIPQAGRRIYFRVIVGSDRPSPAGPR
jgi:outer membrane receptor protein involved in Fe transport